MDFLKYKTEEEVAALCYSHALKLYDNRESLGIEVSSVGELTDLLFDLYIDKAKHDSLTDSLLEYNDEIVSICESGEVDTMDISVSKDNLFYANGVLTKNSFGLPATLDWFVAATQDDVLAEAGQQLWHLLKTRWGKKADIKPQRLNIDWNKMRYSDVDQTSEIQSSTGKNPNPTKRPPKKERNLAEIDWE